MTGLLLFFLALAMGALALLGFFTLQLYFKSEQLRGASKTCKSNTTKIRKPSNHSKPNYIGLRNTGESPMSTPRRPRCWHPRNRLWNGRSLTATPH